MRWIRQKPMRLPYSNWDSAARSRLSFPKILSSTDSRDETESAHHPARCLPSSICLGRLSPTYSSRDRAYWRWKSRGRPGRPRVSRELRELIQRMSKENPLWGAPRIHGELLKLGFEIAESTVSKYMIRRRGPPSQTWRTFLRNHAAAIAA